MRDVHHPIIMQKINGEVALLCELKEIVLDFIHEIEQVNFTDNCAPKDLFYTLHPEITFSIIYTEGMIASYYPCHNRYLEDPYEKIV